VAGRIAEWQRRLESEGSVRFRPSPWVPFLVLAVCVVVTIGTIDEIVHDGSSFWAIAGLVVFGVVGIPLTVWRLLGARGLTVTPETVQSARGPVIPLENVEAVSTRGRSVILDYRPLPGQRMGRRDRSTGLKQQYVPLSPFGPEPGDLAFWLLQVKAGPDARIDVRGGGRRIQQVYQVQKPFWER
jgi:hypothetical protein